LAAVDPTTVVDFKRSIHTDNVSHEKSHASKKTRWSHDERFQLQCERLQNFIKENDWLPESMAADLDERRIYNFISNVRTKLKEDNLSEERQLTLTDICPGILERRMTYVRVLKCGTSANEDGHDLNNQGSGKKFYQVYDSDKVVLVDPATRNLIINVTRILGEKMGKDKRSVVVVNVRLAHGYFKDEGRAISRDVNPGPTAREISTFAEAFVQHASVIAMALGTGKNALVYCQNGRSRSPSVIAAFFIIFRGVPLGELKSWFNEVYPKQRPATARVSAEFPNMSRFEPILMFLQKCANKPTETRLGFNLAGEYYDYISALLSFCFLTSVHLHLPPLCQIMSLIVRKHSTSNFL